MSWIIDALVLALVALVALVEARRGLLLTLTDILRIGLALAGGFGAYSVIHRLSHNYAAGFAALGTVALGLVLLVPFLVRRSGLDPAWSRSIAARLAAGLIGAGIGAAIVVTFMPIANQRPRLQTAIAESLLGSTALDAAPFFYYAADALNLDLPMLNRRARRFEDEGALERAALVERINYRRLDLHRMPRVRPIPRLPAQVRGLGLTQIRLPALRPDLGRVPDLRRVPPDVWTVPGRRRR
jgi:hypothetical protein